MPKGTVRHLAGGHWLQSADSPRDPAPAAPTATVDSLVKRSVGVDVDTGDQLVEDSFRRRAGRAWWTRWSTVL